MTSLIGAGLITAEVFEGLGRHEYYLTSAQRRLFQVLGWADWIQTFITLALMKISICLFLLRIGYTSQVARAMYALITYITLFTAVSVFLFLGVCRPLRAYWDVGVDGVCLSKHQVKSIVLAQGSRFLPLSSNGTVWGVCHFLTTNARSPFGRFRSRSRGTSGPLPAQSPDWNTD